VDLHNNTGDNPFYAIVTRRRPEVPSVEQVRPWAFTIMRRLWQNEVRQNRRETLADMREDDLGDPCRDTPETLLSRKLLRSEIIQAIDALPEVFREVLILREIEELSYAGISEVLGCPLGTVMSRLARARLLLRRQLLKFSPSTREVER
jgi:RNA polymerase sigma-70 factor (ECF subfamily)